MNTAAALAFRCKRCGTRIRKNRTHCPSCGIEVGERPVTARADDAIPDMSAGPGAAAAARQRAKKVACAMCLSSMPEESAMAVSEDNLQVANALGPAMLAQYTGKHLCEGCLQTLTKKGQRGSAPLPPPSGSGSGSGSGSNPASPPPKASGATPAPRASGQAPAPAAPLGAQGLTPGAPPPASSGTQGPPVKQGIAPPGPIHMWVAGGLIGALIGGGAWFGAAAAMDWDPPGIVGIILAIIMGGLTGMGVRAGAGTATGLVPGVVALVIFLSTAVGVHLLIVKNEMAQFAPPNRPGRELAIAEIAAGLLEWEDKDAVLPRNSTPTLEDDYDPKIWADATKAFEELPKMDQDYQIQEWEDAKASSWLGIGLLINYRVIIWLIFASSTAFKTGAGLKQ